jgi:hypothetical protein
MEHDWMGIGGRLDENRIANGARVEQTRRGQRAFNSTVIAKNSTVVIFVSTVVVKSPRGGTIISNALTRTRAYLSYPLFIPLIPPIPH